MQEAVGAVQLSGAMEDCEAALFKGGKVAKRRERLDAWKTVVGDGNAQQPVVVIAGGLAASPCRRQVLRNKKVKSLGVGVDDGLLGPGEKRFSGSGIGLGIGLEDGHGCYVFSGDEQGYASRLRIEMRASRAAAGPAVVARSLSAMSPRLLRLPLGRAIPSVMACGPRILGDGARALICAANGCWRRVCSWARRLAPRLGPPSRRRPWLRSRGPARACACTWKPRRPNQSKIQRTQTLR